jgi:hypothetical protein
LPIRLEKGNVLCPAAPVFIEIEARHFKYMTNTFGHHSGLRDNTKEFLTVFCGSGRADTVFLTSDQDYLLAMKGLVGGLALRGRQTLPGQSRTDGECQSFPILECCFGILARLRRPAVPPSSAGKAGAKRQGVRMGLPSNEIRMGSEAAAHREAEGATTG